MRSRHAHGRLLLEVQNSGPRIDADKVKQVFEPFFTTKPGGTGLGLAIARGVALAHGGELYLSTNDDGVVVFTLEIDDSHVHSANEELDG